MYNLILSSIIAVYWLRDKIREFRFINIYNWNDDDIHYIWILLLPS